MCFARLRPWPLLASTALILLLLLYLTLTQFDPFHPIGSERTISPRPLDLSRTQQQMGIVHIVLFQLKESASKEQAQDVRVSSYNLSFVNLYW